MAGPGVFLKNGFEQVDEVEPGFRLLARTLGPGPVPSLPRDWPERTERFQDLTRRNILGRDLGLERGT